MRAGRASRSQMTAAGVASCEGVHEMTTVVREACAVASAALVISFPLYAQSSAPAADAGIKPAVASSRKFEELPRTEEDGTFFPSHYRQVMKAPLPSLIYKHTDLPTVIDQLTFADGSTGTIAAFQPAG